MKNFHDFEKSVRKRIQGDFDRLKSLHDNLEKLIWDATHSEQYIAGVDFMAGVTVVRLKGKATYDTMKYIEGQFIERTRGKEIHNIIFDFEQVSDADTSSVAELIELWEQMAKRPAGKTIGLVNIPPKLKGLLEITNTKGLFSLFDTKEDAITRLAL